MIMKHVNVMSRESEKYDKDKGNKVKIHRAAQQYDAKHTTEESCSHASPDAFMKRRR